MKLITLTNRRMLNWILTVFLNPFSKGFIQAFVKNSNLAKLDTNNTVHEILKIIKSRDDDLPTERIPKYLTDIAHTNLKKCFHREKDISALVEGLFNQKLTMITGIVWHWKNRVGARCMGCSKKIASIRLPG